MVMVDRRKEIHYGIFLIGLVGLLIGLPFSKIIMSCSGMLLALNWIVEGDWKRKFAIFSSDKKLWLLLFLYFVFIIGQFFSEPFGCGTRMLKTRLPLLYLPLILATTPLKKDHLRKLLQGYAWILAATTLVAWYNFIFNHYQDIRLIYPFCKHINYGIQLCTGFLISLGLWHTNRVSSKRQRYLMLGARLYLFVCMVVFAKYTALIAGIITLFAWGTYHILTKQTKLKKVIFLFATLFVIGGVVGFVGVLAHNYFTPRFNPNTPHPTHTSHGNPYIFNTTSVVENGEYIDVYLCEQELQEAWALRSSLPYEDIKYTLIRYLNSIGQHKDYDAVMQLSNEAISDIENGIANIKYTTPLNRLYVTFFEISNSENIEGKSLMKRLNTWRITCSLIAQRPLTGYGCGSAIRTLQEEQKKQHPTLKPIPDPHQQYLEDALTFGIPLAVAVLAVYIFLLYYGVKTHNLIFVLTLFMLLLTLFIEGNNYQSATTLFAFITSVFTYNNPTAKEHEC